MQCEYCGIKFLDGEAIEPVYRYWTTEERGVGGYTDGVKRTGWAHATNC